MTQAALAGTVLLMVVVSPSSRGADVEPRTLKGHQSSVMAVAFAPDGNTLASSSRDKTIKLWDPATGELKQTLTEHTADVYDVAFSPRGELLASAGGDKTIRLWETKTNKLLRTLEGHTDIVRSVAFAPDEKTLASASVDRTVRLWDVATGKLKHTLEGHTHRVKSVAFTRDGATLASAASDMTIRVWDPHTGRLKRVLEGHTGDLESIAFSPSGRLLASSSNDTTIRLWDLETGQVRHTLKGHSAEIDSVAFSPDGRVVASGSKDMSIKFWDVPTGKLLRTLTGPKARLESVAFSPDGSILASGSGGPESLVWLWPIAEPAKTPVGGEPRLPVQLTAQQDHKRMMELLNIKELRPGANGMNRNAPNAANYDETKVKPFTLPDPLVLKNGQKVTTPEVWRKQRRPEIVEDFDREVYGRVPKETPKVKWDVTSTARENVNDFAAVTRKLVGRVDNSAYPLISVEIQLTLTTPADAKGPVPVIMEFGFVNRVFGPAGRGPSWQQQVLAKGWGYAIIVPNSIQADNGGGLTKGIIGLCNKGQPRKPDDWGALRAWAWGASRALDYFETDKSVDAKKVGIEGLSRYGKAALVAMAYDERFAIGFIGSSGEGGAKLHRRNFGELVENVAGSGEYHWVAGNFLKYAGPLTPNDLPVDAHELIAMCAPRPVFISYGASTGPGAEGQWVDQRGSFQAAVAAAPVYELLGKMSLGTDKFPELETALTDGDVAWRQHKGGHTTGPNWPTFLKWAERYLK